jgi:hypothetical protein
MQKKKKKKKGIVVSALHAIELLRIIRAKNSVSQKNI